MLDRVLLTRSCRLQLQTLTAAAAAAAAADDDDDVDDDAADRRRSIADSRTSRDDAQHREMKTCRTDGDVRSLDRSLRRRCRRHLLYTALLTDTDTEMAQTVIETQWHVHLLVYSVPEMRIEPNTNRTRTEYFERTKPMPARDSPRVRQGENIMPPLKAMLRGMLQCCAADLEQWSWTFGCRFYWLTTAVAVYWLPWRPLPRQRHRWTVERLS